MNRKLSHLEKNIPQDTLNRPDELVFLPLGGSGEIGMNLNLYGFAGKWLMVDLGISFADDTMPGIDIIMPDPQFIADRRDTLCGLILTHAHEDHVGAVAHLWPRLRCPVYATPFTASVLRAKLGEVGLLNEVVLHEIPLSSKITIGPFTVELISVTHSIPEPNALLISTAAGKVLHTGDWKFDPSPQVGPVTDFTRLRSLGDESIDALVGDSTNALREGEAGSEEDVRQALIKLVHEHPRGRIAIACFASNVARLQSAAAAAEAAGRSVALVGRSLWRMEQAARENGYLDNIPSFLSDEEAAELPDEKVLLICTGSQGEPRSALARIASDDHAHISLGSGDLVIFSSRIIPGNERSIGRLQNELIRQGVKLITESDHFVHVSGHPARDELRQMYGMVKPKLAVPVHGENRHLRAHAQLAESCGVDHTILVENGDIVRLAPGPAGIIDQVDTGVLALDGKNLVSLNSGAFNERQRMTSNGTAVVTIVLDYHGKLLAKPKVTVHGLLGVDSPDTFIPHQDAVERSLREMTAELRCDDDCVRDAARVALRRSLSQSHGKKPVTDVHVVRV